MEPGNEPVSSIEDEILRYLTERPYAGDTITGIRQWWLLPRRVDATEQEIKRALDCLVQRGKVAAIVLTDGSIVYRRPSS
jgi:hypothetical protein